VDVGLSDSGLVHISQLSAGYVRDPHDVVAVGDQVRAWVSAIDKDRRRVALTMIAPGTERPKPERPPRGPRRREAPQQQPATQPAGDGAQAAPDRRPRPPQRAAKPRGERRGRRDKRDAPRPVRTGAYEKRAPKTKVPITKAMEEGKEFMRSFGDLLQFHQKKKEQDKPAESAESTGASNGSSSDAPEPKVESHQSE
jgi:hypothetical protein